MGRTRSNNFNVGDSKVQSMSSEERAYTSKLKESIIHKNSRKKFKGKKKAADSTGSLVKNEQN